MFTSIICTSSKILQCYVQCENGQACNVHVSNILMHVNDVKKNIRKCIERNSLSPRPQAKCIVNNKCMCIAAVLIGHSSLCVFIQPQYLVVHNGILVSVPYTMGCHCMPLHVLRAKSKCDLQSIAFYYTPLWMCMRLYIIFQCLQESLNWINSLAMHRSAYEQLFHKMHTKMSHHVQECERKLLL